MTGSPSTPPRATTSVAVTKKANATATVLTEATVDPSATMKPSKRKFTASESDFDPEFESAADPSSFGANADGVDTLGMHSLKRPDNSSPTPATTLGVTGWWIFREAPLHCPSYS